AVVYDDEGGGWEGRMLWLQDSIGFQRCSYLNGGLIAWAQEERPLSRELPAPNQPQTPFQPNLTQQPTASLDYLLERVGAEDLAIWDARSPGEYRGTQVNARRAGHIPGAVNLEWTQLMEPARGYRLMSDDSLRNIFIMLVITPDIEIITYFLTFFLFDLSHFSFKYPGYPRCNAYAGS